MKRLKLLSLAFVIVVATAFLSACSSNGDYEYENGNGGWEIEVTFHCEHCDITNEELWESLENLADYIVAKYGLVYGDEPVVARWYCECGVFRLPVPIWMLECGDIGINLNFDYRHE